MPVNEKLLVTRCQKGDLQAYDVLMQQYEKKVYALCFRMTGNADDALDMAQEAFLKAFRALPTFLGQSSFSTWLFRIVTNTCLDEKRKQKKRPLIVSLDKPRDTKDGEIKVELADEAPDPLSVTLEHELESELQLLLDRLPPDQRTVIIMRDLQGFSYEEIAETLEINMGTLKSRLNRARLHLRELYLKKEEQNNNVLHLKGKGGLKHDL